MPRGTIYQRVRSARIVTDHPADAAAVARGCLRAEEQPVGLQRDVQFIAHYARLHPRPTLLRIDLQNMVEMPADIHHDAIADHLAGNGSAAGARNEASASLPRQADQFADILHRFRIRHPLRHLAVNARVGGIRYLMD